MPRGDLAVCWFHNEPVPVHQTKNLSEDRDTKITRQIDEKRTACHVVIWLSVGFTMNRYLCINQKIYQRTETEASQLTGIYVTKK